MKPRDIRRARALAKKKRRRVRFTRPEFTIIPDVGNRVPHEEDNVADIPAVRRSSRLQQKAQMRDRKEPTRDTTRNRETTDARAFPDSRDQSQLEQNPPTTGYYVDEYVIDRLVDHKYAADGTLLFQIR